MKTSGFTLIELIVVIAILGILATAVLLTINPGEKLAQARDSTRLTDVGELGQSMESYFINTGQYPVYGSTWESSMVTSGDLKNIIPGVTPYTIQCWSDAINGQGGSAQAVNNFCYVFTGGVGYAWAALESQQEKNKCGVNGTPYYVYDTSIGRACIKCSSTSSYNGACNATQ